MNYQEKMSNLLKINGFYSPHQRENFAPQADRSNNLSMGQIEDEEMQYNLEYQQDGNFQLKYKYSSTSKKNKDLCDKLIYSEMFELEHLELLPINIKYVPYNEYEELSSLEIAFMKLMTALNHYDNIFLNMTRKNEDKNTVVQGIECDLNYTITQKKEDLKLIMKKELFPPYMILKLRSIFTDFENMITFDFKNRYPPTYKINILSFLTVFMSKIVKYAKNIKNPNIYFKETGYGVAEIVTSFLNKNSILYLILKSILKQILTNESILKMIRGIYVKFVDKEPIFLHEKEDLADHYFVGLEKLFRYTKTSYYMNKYMLIIEISVVSKHKSFDEVEKASVNSTEYSKIAIDVHILFINKIFICLIFRRCF